MPGGAAPSGKAPPDPTSPLKASLPLLLLIAVSSLAAWWWVRRRRSTQKNAEQPLPAATSFGTPEDDTDVARYLREQGLGAGSLAAETGVARYLRELDPALALNAANTGLARYLRALEKGSR
jgi:hypothetical protein